MSRPSHISDAQILDAAQRVFLERGFQQATTALIAERAGISEGSIFNHFRDKATLFTCAMEYNALAILETLTGAGQGDARANLEHITLAWLEFMLDLVPKVMMLWSHRCSVDGPGGDHGPPSAVLERVADYFQIEMDLGRMRRTDPAILGRVWLGTLWSYAMQTVMSGPGRSHLPARDAYVRGVVDQLWFGLSPQAPPVAPPPLLSNPQRSHPQRRTPRRKP